MSLFRAQAPRAGQQGVVLLVVLVLLLLTTIVGFQVMETSSLETRMAVARQGQEVTFQAMESVIDQAKNDQDLLVQAFASSLASPNDPNAVTQDYNFTGDTQLQGDASLFYVDEIATLGNDLVIGNAGLRSLHFEIRAEGGRQVSAGSLQNNRFDALHLQGMKRFAPKPQ
ncbi:MAG: PilX N-terminal domain-containing pilus assembly protein [Pseudomonadota bacterium]